MRLRRIHVRRAPGMPRGLAPLEPGGGVTVVVGSNGAGKTTLCRAVRGTLWPETAPDGYEVSSLWETHDGNVTADHAGGRTAWRDDGAGSGTPARPDAHLARCWTLELTDLLDSDDETDGHIARAIGVQLHGGYDLGAVRDELFALRPRHGSTEKKRLDEARRAVRRVRDEHVAISEREKGLAELERRATASEDAARSARLLEHAVDLARARAELDAVTRELGGLPAAMSRVSGAEREELERLETERRERADAVDTSRATLDAARRAAEEVAARLGAAAPSPEALSAWRVRARQLAERERERDTAREAAEAAAHSASEQLAGLGFAPEAAGSAIDPPTPAERNAISELIQTESDLRNRASELRQNADAARFREPDRAFAWLAAGAGTAAAALLGGWHALVEPLTRSTLFVGGLGVFVLLIFAIGAWHQPRRRRRIDLAAYERQRAKLLAEQDEFEERRVRLAERLGLQPGTAPLGMAEAANALSAARDLRAKAAEAETRAARVAAEIDAERERAGRELLGPGDDGPPRDAAALAARVDALEAAEREARDARERARVAGETLAAAERESEKLAARRRELFARFDLRDSDAAGLLALVDRHGEWKALRERRTGLASRVGDLEAKLTGHDRLRASGLDVAELESELRQAEERAAAHAGLVQQIADVRSEIAAARTRDEMSAARAAEQQARDALGARRSEALRALAGRALLDSVEREYEQTSRPEVLDRADRLFGRFTAGRYALRVSAGGSDAAPVAVDADSGASLAPHELSDGTRVQMQLALRMAFAAHVEPGSPLPLLLDEAIATSDDARFSAIAAALLQLAEDGRQIVYLTSNRADLARWNLAAREAGASADKVRVLQMAADGSAEPAPTATLELPPMRRVEVPRDGERASDYAVRLGVPALDGWIAPESSHVYWAVPDDAALLHALVGGGTRTVGRLLALGRAALAGASGIERLDDGEARLARAIGGAEIVRETVAAWRVGRGRPMHAADLADCPAVSEGWLERLAELLAECRHDAALFLEAFGPPKHALASGFRTAKLRELRAWAREKGFLDAREPLGGGAMTERVAGTLLHPRPRVPLSLAEIERRVLWLASALAGSAPERPDAPDAGDPAPRDEPPADDGGATGRPGLFD